MERCEKGIHDVKMQGRSLGILQNCCSLFLDIINNASASPCERIVALILISEAAPFKNSGNGRVGSTQLVKHLSNRLHTGKRCHRAYNDLIFPFKETHGILEFKSPELHFSPWKQFQAKRQTLDTTSRVQIHLPWRMLWMSTPTRPFSPFPTASLTSCSGTVSKELDFFRIRSSNTTYGTGCQFLNPTLAPPSYPALNLS